MATYRTPGVYVEEVPLRPPSVAAAKTAIPIFIGYTEKAKEVTNDDLRDVAKPIRNFLEYQDLFGGPNLETGIVVSVNTDRDPVEVQSIIGPPSQYHMYYAIQSFYNNGGEKCYVVSAGNYNSGAICLDDLKRGLEIAGRVEEVTLIVFPDGQGLQSASDYYDLQKTALRQCSRLTDRFNIMDVYVNNDAAKTDVEYLREMMDLGVSELKYGAAYYPRILTTMSYHYDDESVVVNLNGLSTTLTAIASADADLSNFIKNEIAQQLKVPLHPSGSVAGIYAQTDNNRGVWKAPANVALSGVEKPYVKITDAEQDGLNVDVNSGKSINAIRSFTGRGTLVWGARTLAGNDNEWRYVSVRRFFNMVEDSVKRATGKFVFEPNDANTWVRIRAMIENFLTQQWQAGALAGSTPEQAFFVRVGLGETMTAADILEGRMIVEIGMAVVRPAEFIILRFSHKMQES